MYESGSSNPAKKMQLFTEDCQRLTNCEADRLYMKIMES